MPSDDTRETVDYFDMGQIMPGATILIIGKKFSGKTALVFDIMSHMSKWFPDENGETGFDGGKAITPTVPSVEKFARCIPRSFIEKPSIDSLDEFVRTVNTEYTRDSARGNDTRNTFLICDDTAFDDKFMRCKTLSEVFLNGRNFGMTCILVLQYLMKVGPDLRSNADFVFVFFDNNTKNADKIWEYWFAMMPKKTFKTVFSDCTRGYSVLVMDVRKSATSRDWHECVFWYKATLPEEHPPFQLCRRDMYLLDEYCAADDADERDVQCSNQDRVWRLGPNGNIYDAPSYMVADS